MTATLSAVTVLSDEEREGLLAALARTVEWNPHVVLMAELATLAHPSLSPARRAYHFADYCDASMNAAALRAGIAEWQEFYNDGDFRSWAGDPHDRALDLLNDRAAEAMYALVNGECER